jgi:hypothetical protein
MSPTSGSFPKSLLGTKLWLDTNLSLINLWLMNLWLMNLWLDTN